MVNIFYPLNLELQKFLKIFLDKKDFMIILFKHGSGQRSKV